MKPEWIAFEILANSIQGVLLIWFIRKKLHLVKPQILYALIAVAAITLYLSLYLFIDIALPDTLVFLLPLGYAFLTSDDKWTLKIFWSALLAAVFIGTIEMILSFHMHIFSVSWTQITSETPQRMIFVVSTNLTILIILFLLTRQPYKKNSMPVGTVVLFSTVEIINLLIAEGIFALRINLHVNSRIVSLVSIGILMSSCFSMILFEYMSAVAEENQKYADKIKLSKLTAQHLLEIKNMYTVFLAKQHDLEKKVEMAKYLTDNTSREENHLEHLIKERPTVLMTGCVMVDALLTAKLSAIEHLGISIDYKPYPLNALPIDENSFCLILANLLDNAIEGVQRIPEANKIDRTIHFSCARSWNMFFIHCSNPVNQKSIKKNKDTYLSSKIDAPYEHGYGISNIQNIVRNNGGRCTFALKNDLFIAEIMLPFSSIENDNPSSMS